ncbi:hypothetical protein KSP39_PZI019159 [Platanthera zijinensis]|uniref:Uncharacterized protein n=1 Tax=Platanthera zijinensis TaxID=2320716 RepID=A0AAP0B129_9ASPA
MTSRVGSYRMQYNHIMVQKEPRKQARGPSPTDHLARKEPWDMNTEDQAQPSIYDSSQHYQPVRSDICTNSLHNLVPKAPKGFTTNTGGEPPHIMDHHRLP